MGYFQVRYNSRVLNYDCRGSIRLATEQEIEVKLDSQEITECVQIMVVAQVENMSFINHKNCENSASKLAFSHGLFFENWTIRDKFEFQ